MTTALLEMIGVTAIAMFLGLWRLRVSRRNAASWDSLMARLRPGWNARELTGFGVSASESNAAALAHWRKLWTAHGLWAMYTNAGVLLEMASYAERHDPEPDQQMLARLRYDALQIRVNVVKTALLYAGGAVRESIAVSALRAEAAYMEMTTGVLALLEQNSAGAIPAFVAVM